jgi:hypothetical protein
LQAELLEIVYPLRFLSNVLARWHRLVPNKLHNKSVSKVCDGMSQANCLEHAAQIASANLPNNQCKVHRQRLSAGRKRNTYTDSIEPWRVSEALRAHFVRMTFAMKKNESTYPVNICLFGPNRVMFDAQMPAYAIEQFWRTSDGSSGRGHGRNRAKIEAT